MGNMIKSIKSILRNCFPEGIRAHRIWGGLLRGQKIVTSWRDYPAAILGYTERSLLDWFTKNVKQGQTWLDIGAHYGYTAIALSRLVGVDGRVFAFEPMLSTAGYVTQTRQLNNFPQLTVVPYGLAVPETLEIISLPVTRGMVDSSIDRTTDDGHRAEWLETIIVTRFDWLWPKICGERPQIDGVKIDVQGMEIEVLKGMLNVLKSFKPKLVLEVHHGVDRDELLNLIAECGYSLHATPIEPIPGEVEAQFIDDMSYAFDTLQA
jgi:FkbM family methyltransferase